MRVQLFVCMMGKLCYDENILERGATMTTLYGMAVLLVYLVCILLSYSVFKDFNLKHFYPMEKEEFAQYAIWLISISIGSGLATFLLSIIETVQNITLTYLN